jgi:hypothetical protein
MRPHHVIAIAVVLVVGFGAKVALFSSPAAEAQLEIPTNVSTNVLQMHHDYPNMKGLPGQKTHDMTFVFSDGD